MHRFQLFILAAVVAPLVACGGAARKPLHAELAPLPVVAPAPKPLQTNHFKRDRVASISEAAMREILAAPVYLEEHARLGIVPVQSAYELDRQIPLTAVTGALGDHLATTGLFEVVSEVTTDWPGTRSIAGLRELATRYRAEYLLLYRHRFVDRTYTNIWGWAYLTAVGGLFVPSQTLESAGVLEATLFDVKTGTLLFTVFERVHEEQMSNVWHNELKTRRMQERLLSKAADQLSDQVIGKLQKLLAARPTPTDKTIATAPNS